MKTTLENCHSKHQNTQQIESHGRDQDHVVLGAPQIAIVKNSQEVYIYLEVNDFGELG